MCGLLEGPLRDQWELHHTVKVTDTPATYSFGHVVGLAALDMVQPWAELDVAGVGLSFANWMAVVIAPYIVFVLMLDLLHFVFRSRVACLWIGPRLALAARCGYIYSLSLSVVVLKKISVHERTELHVHIRYIRHLRLLIRRAQVFRVTVLCTFCPCHKSSPTLTRFVEARGRRCYSKARGRIYLWVMHVTRRL